MLVLVLILMLIGFGVLVVASLTGTVAWAWVAVVASVVAAAVLVASWRRHWATDVEPYPVDPHVLDPRRLEPQPVNLQPAAPPPAAPPPAAPPPAALPAQPVSEAIPPVGGGDSHGGEPGEERANPADLAFVATLDRQVLVVDEQPRYHLAGCPVLSGRRVVGLPAREAVALDFTPCGVCAPVRVLASAQSGLERSSGRRR